MQLQQFFNEYPKIAVAFSGGVDSSYLLFAAKTAGCDVRAYTINSEFQPEFEIEEAKQMAEDLNVPITIYNFIALNDPKVAENSPERCYYCKTKILEKLWELVRTDGYEILCDGTNADDDEGDRPGMRACKEQNILSPLRLCGMTKNKIRELSKQAGLFTHNKPAYACLATRIPANTEITPKYLQMIERAESSLFKMGFSDFRVRLIPPTAAKLQFPAEQWSDAASRRYEIITALKQEFDDILLDLKER